VTAKEDKIFEQFEHLAVLSYVYEKITLLVKDLGLIGFHLRTVLMTFKKLHLKSHQRWSPSVVVGGPGPACRDRNDHQPHGSSCVSDKVLFSHE